MVKARLQSLLLPAVIILLFQRNGQAICWQIFVCDFRPFDNHNALITGFLQPKFSDFGRIPKPVKIKMVHRRFTVVKLFQRIGRTGNLQVAFSRNLLDDGSGKRGFAGTQRARERDAVSRPECHGNITTDFAGLRFIIGPQKNGLVVSGQLKGLLSRIEKLDGLAWETANKSRSTRLGLFYMHCPAVQFHKTVHD